jgi:hypothetical protein
MNKVFYILLFAAVSFWMLSEKFYVDKILCEKRFNHQICYEVSPNKRKCVKSWQVRQLMDSKKPITEMVDEW